MLFFLCVLLKVIHHFFYDLFDAIVHEFEVNPKIHDGRLDETFHNVGIPFLERVLASLISRYYFDDSLAQNLFPTALYLYQLYSYRYSIYL